MVSFQINAPRWGGVSQDGTYKTPEKIAIPKGACAADHAGSRSIGQNEVGTLQDDWHKSDTSGSVSVHGANENPGALAGATGAMSNELAFKAEDYRKPRGNAMSLYAKDGHKRACRMLGYALTLNDPAMWGHTAAVLSHRLTSMELVSLAFTVMSALDPGDREAVFNAAQWGVA